jgi:dienelactone hydrolase
MTSHLEWLAEQAGSACVERAFVLHRSPGPVPGILWSPATEARRPAAVLLFHGGSGHKRNERQLRMGRWLASTARLAAIAIDGPYHGDRVAAPMAASVYQRLIADEGIERVTDRITADWLESCSALADQGLADDAHVSVFGLSMGARFGLPVAAALGSRLQCLVFGKFGIQQAKQLHPGICAPDLILAAARAITAPALFQVQWDDATFPRAGQFDLFSALASTDKRLCARPGQHADTHPDDESSWLEFLRSNSPR